MEIIKRFLTNRNYEDRKTWGLEFICMHTEGLPKPIPPRADPTCFNQFNNPANKVSAHFYVKRNRQIEQYVDIKYAAWAVGSQELNIKSISIEHQDDGRWNDASYYTDAQYESSAQLVAWIWGQVGRKPLYPHNKFSTKRACPGKLNIGRIESRAVEIVSPPKVDNIYRVSKDNVQKGAYNEKYNAFNFWYTDKGQVVTYQNNNITNEFLTMATELEESIEGLRSEKGQLENQIVELNEQIKRKDTEIAAYKAAIEDKPTQPVEFNLAQAIAEFIKRLWRP